MSWCKVYEEGVLFSTWGNSTSIENAKKIYNDTKCKNNGFEVLIINDKIEDGRIYTLEEFEKLKSK